MNLFAKFPVRVLFALSLVALITSACDEERSHEMVGTLERDRVQLSFESNEPISASHMADGARVKAGDLLIEQDAERMRLELSRLQAERDLAAARLAESVRGPREEQIREAQALLESAHAEAKNATANLQRIRDVYDKGLSTREALDLAETRHSTALAQQAAQKESLEALLNGTTAEELQQAEATLAIAEAALRPNLKVVREMDRSRNPSRTKLKISLRRVFGWMKSGLASMCSSSWSWYLLMRKK